MPKPTAQPIPLRIALYEGAGSSELSAGERGELLKAFLEKGLTVSCIRPGRAVAPPPGGELLVLGRFAESKPNEAQDAGAGVTVRFRDTAGLSIEQVTALVDELRGGPPAKPWKPW